MIDVDFKPHPDFSTFLRSTCCDAPVRQEFDTRHLLAVASCARCGAELGAPGAEDIEPLFRRNPQCGCEGLHNGPGTPDCPRRAHHHHDRFCLPPIDVQAERSL